MRKLSLDAQLVENKDCPVVLCKIASLPKRYRRLVDDSGDCWIWLGAKRTRTYKHRRYSYGTYAGKLAHRLMYEAVFGPIPSHLELDHICNRKLCVNPAHLRAVTHQVNCAARPKSGPYPDPNSIRSKAGYYLRRDQARAALVLAAGAGL